MARKVAAVVFSLGCLQTSSALALGLGELTLDSFLNEPLKAEVSLLDAGGLHEDQIRIKLATREDFEKMGVERAYFLTSIQFDVEIDASGRGRIVITSEDPVLEPYLDFIVEARWPSGRLLREYTVLVDPPLFDESVPVISASEQVAEQEGIPAPAKKKSEPAATSGTRVDVRKSDLGPGEMPQRGFNADVAGSPAPGARYMISRDETLWEIALAARPEGASVHQTMLDIQRLNPDAFIDGNINRIKAGYIVYLPSSAEISSDDQAAAMANVRQQNEDWRAGRASEPAYSAGPSLRISADTDTADTDAAATEGAAAGADVASGEVQPAAGSAATEELEKAARERSEMAEELVAMEQQVETLERIVNLKDEQIAALQAALAEAGQEPDADVSAETAMSGETPAGAGPEGLAELDQGEMPEGGAAQSTALADDAEPVTEPVAVVDEPAEKPAPAKAAEPKPPAEKQGGLSSSLLYGLGALVLAILGFLFLRRRGEQGDEEAAQDQPSDVFADVKLKEQALDVAEVEPAPAAAETLEAEPEPEPELENVADSRGYGERKHDEYASDVDAGDALAEADIYVAYGRYPQAVDLLRNASANEPGNPAFKLKLLEIFAETGDRDGVMQQLADLEKIGDENSLARAEEVLRGMDTSAAARSSVAAAAAAAPLAEDLAADASQALESDFGGLEIEEAVEEQELADDLDLSGDFAEEEKPPVDEGEDLMLAAESNGFSTKLDLARAYLDMGDEDGARQILQEVVAEAPEEVKSEARALLERIG